MEAKKIERIILLLLALLNLALLVVVLRDYAERQRSRGETQAVLTALLTENGIETAPSVELLQSCPPACTLTRDLDMEQQRVRRLLGRGYHALDQGGSIWFYESDRGQLVMRGTGEMALLLTGEDVLRGSSGAKAVQNYFARAELSLFSIGAEEGDSIRLCCGWNGCPVFNAGLQCDFSAGRLYMVSGTMVFNVESQTEPEAGMDSVSALVRFVNLGSAEGIIFSRLDGLAPGYYVHLTMSGESTLTPVWRIETDTGSFYLNAVTGLLETPPA